jgi:hypothetical protein
MTDRLDRAIYKAVEASNADGNVTARAYAQALIKDLTADLGAGLRGNPGDDLALYHRGVLDGLQMAREVIDARAGLDQEDVAKEIARFDAMIDRVEAAQPEDQATLSSGRVISQLEW